MKISKAYSFCTVLLVSFLLVACSGDDSRSSSGDNGQAPVSVFVTDNLLEDYSKVWVDVREVAATSAQGTEVVLFHDDAGTVFNLTELADVGSLLSVQQVPEGVYTSFHITLTNSITLVDHMGNSIAAQFAPGGDLFAIEVSGEVVVRDAEPTSFALDFDLTQFVYDETTGLVTPEIVIKDEDEVEALSRSFADIEGRVVEVIDADSFVMRSKSKYGEMNITINLNAAGLIAYEEQEVAESDTANLQVGDEVEVLGNFDHDSLAIDALVVLVEMHEAASSECMGDDNPEACENDDEHEEEHHRLEVKGEVIGFDGVALVLDIREADFIPEGDEFVVYGVNEAFFESGNAELLTAGKWVEIRGYWEGEDFYAKVVGVEGSPEVPQEYAELRARVLEINELVVRVEVLDLHEHEGDSGAFDELVVNLADSFVKHGSLECLAVGGIIEAKGGFDGEVFVAKVVSLTNDCLTEPSDDDETATLEIIGEVLERGDGKLQMQVTQSDDESLLGETVLVRFSDAEFHEGSAEHLMHGALIKVLGEVREELIFAYDVFVLEPAEDEAAETEPSNDEETAGESDGVNSEEASEETSEKASEETSEKATAEATESESDSEEAATDNSEASSEESEQASEEPVAEV